VVREQPVAFNESQLEGIEICLEKLVSNIGAQEVLLADIAGRLILARGRLGEKQTTATGVAALSAGGYGATVEMARYFEIDTEFKQITYEGEHHSIYSTSVGNALIITVVFDHSIKLGVVRAFTNRAAQCLQDVVKRALAEMEADDRLSEAEKIEAEFGQALMDELETLLV
jgi:predicted regulator of Ras-like GTPase activity (Roadblock/LC7/MglB family)